MAKISDVAYAFIVGRPATCHNASTDGEKYVLHRTVIARKVNGRIHFNWGGYHTVTTANHMNKIIAAGNLGQRVSYAQDRDNGIDEFVR